MMSIILRNLSINIIAALIRDKKARDTFRDKYKIKPYKKLDAKRMFIFGSDIQDSCRKFCEEIDKPDLTEKYKNLIRGLDDESINCISQIIGRINLICQQNIGTYKNFKGGVDIFSEDELLQLDKLKKEFNQRILPLADGCYAYKQHILPVNQFRANVFYYKHDITKLRHLERIKSKDIIDAGGCIADSAIMMTEFTTGRIYTFEPTTVNYDIALKTIELNSAKNIIPVKQGLGSKDESLFIKLCHENYGENKITKDQFAQENSDDYEQISITSLDNFVKGKDLDIGLIKVDVEGFEQEFLKGAYNTIKKYKPAMLISIYHSTSDFFDIKPMIESWDLGYTFKVSRPVDGGLLDETMLICEQD